jgi:hypothetical protein
VGVFGIDGMPGIGDMLGLFSIGIFMSFIIESQQSFIWLADISAFMVEPRQPGCRKSQPQCR